MKRAALLGSIVAVAVLVALWILSGGERRAGDARSSFAVEPPSPAAEPAATLVEATAPVADERRPAARDEPTYVSEAEVEAATRELATEEPVVRLHVRDARNRRELASVFVIELDRRLDSSVTRPGPLAERAEHEGSSPMPLAIPGPEERTVFARSPGFAWGRIDIGPHQHDRFLDLEPGGDLRVRVTGRPRDPGTVVRVARVRAPPMVELELHTADELLFQALPTGAHEVAAQIGTPGNARTFAHEFVDIDAGSETRVTLVLEPFEPVRWVQLAGTLVLPPEWNLDDFQLLFRIQGPALERWPGTASVDRVEMTIENRETGLYSWYADDVQPGIYALELPQLGYGRRIVIGPAGDTEVRIVIGPPCAVRLRCLDALTREPTGMVELWHGSGDEDVPVALQPVTGWNVELSAFEFHVPCDPLWITHMRSEPYRGRRFQLGSGLNELEYELRGLAPTGVRLSLKEDDGPVPWDALHLHTIESLEGTRPIGEAPVVDGERWPSSWPARVHVDHTGLTMLVEGAGRYRLRVPDLAGYRPVPERDVELRAAQTVAVVIELVRER